MEISSKLHFISRSGRGIDMFRRILLQTQCLIMVALVLFSYASLAYGASGPLEIKAASAILVESQRGQILFEKDPKEKVHIASANKIMTVLLALEKMHSQLDVRVTVSKKAASVEGSILGLEVGDKYTVEDLVYSVLLNSANDSANVLAEYIGGDEKRFVELMNNRARELKMLDTHFTNPTGLYDEAQYTTAYDVALLIRHAISKSIAFDNVFSSKAKPWMDQTGTQVLINSNELFWRYDGVDGGMTGYNEIERQTAITTATRNGQRLISIVLECPEQSLYDDSVRLLDYGFENFRTGILVSKGKPLKRVPVGDKSVDLVSISDYYYTYPVGENHIKNIEFKIKENLKPPVIQNEVIGMAKYILKDETTIEVNLYPSTNVYSSVSWFSSLVKKMDEYRDITILLVVLLSIEIIFVLSYIMKLIKSVLSKLMLKFRS